MQRDIRKVALAIVRHAGARLPGWLAVERARPTAARKKRSHAAYVRVRATLVPNIFRNIAERGSLVRPVGCGPVSARRPVFIELCAADGDVEGCGSEAVHGETLSGRGWLTVAVASGGAIIAAGNNHGNTLSGGLLPEIVEEGVLCLSESLFALAKTCAENRRQIIVHDVKRREIDAVGRVGAGGDNKFNSGFRRDRAGPFDVQIGFRFFATGQVSGIRTVEYDLGIVDGESKGDAENLHVGEIDIVPRHDGDALPGSIDSILIKSGGVVDFREVPWRKIMLHAGRAAKGEVRLPQAGVGDAAGLPQDANHRLLPKIMQSSYPGDHWRQGCRDLRIGGVGVMHFPIHNEGMNGGVKSIPYLRGSSAELDDHAALGNAVHVKTARCEPDSELLNIRGGRPKSLREFSGRKPGVEVRRRFILLPGEKTLQRRF